MKYYEEIIKYCRNKDKNSMAMKVGLLSLI